VLFEISSDCSRRSIRVPEGLFEYLA
jgi:hypothetical protein